MNWAKRLLLLLALGGMLGGCATGGGADPRDPAEPFNRAMYNFNDGVDRAVLKPVAEGYRTVVPSLIRAGVSNFFSNLEDIWIGANNLLQGKVEHGLGDLLRFAFNTGFGLGGILDVATTMGLEKHNEDFGQTLGRWGMDSGPYLVLPFFGPSTLRDGLARIVDHQADIVRNLRNVPGRNVLYATRLVNTRAELLEIGNVVEEAALDKYSFIRESYLQRRESLIRDGARAGSRDRRSDADPAAPAAAVAERVDPSYATPAAMFSSGADAGLVSTSNEGVLWAGASLPVSTAR